MSNGLVTAGEAQNIALKAATLDLHHPAGMVENSPAFQRWDPSQKEASPKGTAEKMQPQPSLRDLLCGPRIPSVETLGYSRLSLRDKRSFWAGTAMLCGPPTVSHYRHHD